MRKELLVYIESNEEGLEVELRNGIEPNTVCLGFEGMKFIVKIDELSNALKELVLFTEGDM